jgi:murein DD-endopeptidase MepM/ murein hydrolase activator NlpD
MGIPSFGAPLPIALATSGWGEDRSYRGAGAVHEGVDFTAPIGTPILAVGDGVVVNADTVANSFAGKNVAVTHDGGLTSQYFHMSQVDVKKNDRVRKGQQLGLSGNTSGGAAGPTVSTPHLHFGFKMLESMLGNYVAKFGMPKTGFGPTTSPWGISVPTEPLLPFGFATAAAKAKIQANAAKNGLKFYSKVGLGVVAAILLGVGAWWFFMGRKRTSQP